MGSEAATVVTRFYEAFDDGDIAAAAALADDALEMMDPGLGTVNGPGPFRDYLAALKRAVPDAKAVIELTVEAHDTVVVEGRFVGTFTGPLASPDGDIDPNGATVELSFADVSTVRNGKLVSYHTYYDQLGLLTQLGLMDD
jgi:ketosteroid isomerase-like protein